MGRQTRSWSADSDGNCRTITRKELEALYEDDNEKSMRYIRRNSIDLTVSDGVSKRKASSSRSSHFVTSTLRKKKDWTKTTSMFIPAPGRVVGGVDNYKIEHKSFLKSMKSIPLTIDSKLGLSSTFFSYSAQGGKTENRINDEYLSGTSNTSRELMTSFAVAGDVIGALELVSGNAIIAAAVCDSVVAAYEIPSEILRDFISRSPDGMISTNLVRQAGLISFELHYPQLLKVSSSMRKWIFQRMDMIYASDNLQFSLKSGKVCLVHGYINKVGTATVDPPIKNVSVFDSPNATVSGIGNCIIAHLPSSFCLLLEKHSDAIVNKTVQPSQFKVKKHEQKRKIVLPWLMQNARMRRMMNSMRVLSINDNDGEEKEDEIHQVSV